MRQCFPHGFYAQFQLSFSNTPPFFCFHREETGDGCPLVALGSDAARQSDDVRKTFEVGIKAHLQVLEKLLDHGAEDKTQKAQVMLALMVGAVTLSRIVTDQALADTLLNAALLEAKRLAAEE